MRVKITMRNGIVDELDAEWVKVEGNLTFVKGGDGVTRVYKDVLEVNKWI